MIFYAIAMLTGGLAIAFTSASEFSPCPADTVAITVTSSANVQELTNELACDGKGSFSITWNSSLTVQDRIEVSDNKNVTITGTGIPSSTFGAQGDDCNAPAIVMDGSGSGIFSVSNGSILRLNNLVLEGGNTDRGGAVDVLSSSFLFIFDCIFTRNTALKGGAIYASTSSIYVDGNTTFGSNSAQDGGAIYADSSVVGIDGSTVFVSNAASGEGGAVYLDSSTIGIHGHTMFTSNSAEGMGGAIDARVSSEIAIDGSAIFANNSVKGDAGALYPPFSSGISIDGSATFANNSAGLDGGAIHAYLSEISIDGSAVFAYNSAERNGGAIYTWISEIRIDGSAMFGFNSAKYSGGAIVVDLSKMCIDGSAIFGDNSANFGGALGVTSSEFSIDGSAILANNSVGSYGGAIYAWLSDIGIHGSAMFANNSAKYFGGAIRADSSDISINGSARFTSNSAGEDGGAIYAIYASNVRLAGRQAPTEHVSGNEGGVHSEAGRDYTYDWSIAFIENYAGGLGGAMHTDEPGLLEVDDAMFKSNRGSLGGAVYIAAVDDKRTIFSACVFEGNAAEDGGAVYFYTGPGLDIFTASVFRNNFALTSGGAIFHTGSLRLFNATFVANEVGVEGPAIMSIGVLEELSNVSFSENTYYCRAGQYSYIVKDEADFCSTCFDEVCSRCSGGRNGANDSEEVRIDGFPVCAVPPVGAVAPSSGTTVATLTLEKGYFRTSNQSHDVLKCYQESACRGGNDADEYCSSGYTGPYCVVCAEGFAPGISYSCRECSRATTRLAVGLTVALIVVVVLTAALVLIHLGSVAPVREDESTEIVQRSWMQTCCACQASLVKSLPLTAIKIVVTVWQIISQYDAITGDVFPEVYANFISKLNPINLDLDFVFSYSCLVTNDFYDALRFATIVPLLVLVLLAGGYFIGKKRHSGSESAMREVQHKHQTAGLYVAFFVYSPVSNIIFQTFGCDELDDGETYLRADYSLSCLTSRHSWYEIYALTMVGVYPVGISAAFVWLLVSYRRDLVKSDRETMLHLRPLHGLWAAYKPSRYFYEVVECTRRIVWTGIAAFSSSNSMANVSIALLCAVVFVFISEGLSPFNRGVDMGLYRWGNGIIVASMYVAFLMKIDIGRDTTSYLLTFSGVLIAANVFMVVAVLLQVALLVIELRRVKHPAGRVDVPARRTRSAPMRSVGSRKGEGVSDFGPYRHRSQPLEDPGTA